MRRFKLASRYRGIGDVTRKAKPVARVSYDVRCRRAVDTAHAGEEQAGQVSVQALIDGEIQVLHGEASLYNDELYTLHLESKHGREFDFYAQPVDVVTGMYHVQGHGGFRQFPRRH